MSGAQVDLQSNNGRPALKSASQNGHSDLVHELLVSRAHVDLQDENGLSALMLASHN